MEGDLCWGEASGGSTVVAWEDLGEPTMAAAEEAANQQKVAREEQKQSEDSQEQRVQVAQEVEKGRRAVEEQ